LPALSTWCGVDKRYYHPKCDRHFVHVIPEAPAYTDIREGYIEHASRNPWSEVISETAFRALSVDRASDYWTNPHTVYVLWTSMPAPNDEDRYSDDARHAEVYGVYSEALDIKPSRMLLQHRESWERYRTECAPTYDAVLCHTPEIAYQINRATDRAAYVLPVGWNPQTMGRPDWKRPRSRRYAFHGSPVGLRAKEYPELERECTNLTGLFGAALLKELRDTEATIYVPHSPVRSFSSWRLWQCVATGTAMVVPGMPWSLDVWPADARQHLQSWRILPAFHFHDARPPADWLALARDMHEDLGPEFTLDRCIDNYLVEAVLDLE